MVFSIGDRAGWDIPKIIVVIYIYISHKLSIGYPIPIGSMVLEYLPTNWDYLENYYLGVNVGVNIPAPWILWVMLFSIGDRVPYYGYHNGDTTTGT